MISARPLTESTALIRKLDHCGVRGCTLNWIQAFLSGRTQKVIVDGAKSDLVPIVSGVPQGSVLGPILFLAFVNDLLLHITSNARLFVDDCVVYKEIKTIGDCKSLQEDLKNLVKSEKLWVMSFHRRNVASYVSTGKCNQSSQNVA